MSLSVRAGEAVAVIGENGAGKSTLLRICAGLIRPNLGHSSLQATERYVKLLPQPAGPDGAADRLNDYLAGRARRS